MIDYIKFDVLIFRVVVGWFNLFYECCCKMEVECIVVVICCDEFCVIDGCFQVLCKCGFIKWYSKDGWGVVVGVKV